MWLCYHIDFIKMYLKSILFVKSNYGSNSCWRIVYISQSIHNSLNSAIYKCLITDCLFHIRSACQNPFGRLKSELCKGKLSCSSAPVVGKRTSLGLLVDFQLLVSNMLWFIKYEFSWNCENLARIYIASICMARNACVLKYGISYLKFMSLPSCNTRAA